MASTTTVLTPAMMPLADLGEAIPDTPHAVSVSLPSWKANVGYEEGEQWVLSKMKNGYPRFFVHKSIQAFAEAVARKHGALNEQAVLFPSTAVATRCLEFLHRCGSRSVRRLSASNSLRGARIIDLILRDEAPHTYAKLNFKTIISAVVFPSEDFLLAKTFWQHTGDGVSSRRAEFCYKAFEEGHLTPRIDHEEHDILADRTCKGPRRYQRKDSLSQKVSSSRAPYSSTLWNDASNLEGNDSSIFVEERFGRNLNISLATKAKLAIRKRIAGSLTAVMDLQAALNINTETGAMRKVHGLSENDIYLYPTGMSSIFNTHRMLLDARGSKRSIMFGFPYIDTLKILEKWGPGCQFYGHGSASDLDDLEIRCKAGEKFLALFCEFPGNPLLKSPDLLRIRRLADQYDFALVVDETIGNFLNVHVLPHADIMVSSLTKVFSGDSNVMGGRRVCQSQNGVMLMSCSCVLNPHRRYYGQLQQALEVGYEDNYWPEDAVFMERNSRDFVSRNDRINANAEAICEVLNDSAQVKSIYYPKYGSNRRIYDGFRNLHGGYGGLLSVTFHSAEIAATFFDAIEIAKGPSLGTNFTLCSPYVILAHYHELDWAARFGVEMDLIRLSVGLEDMAELTAKCKHALDVVRTLDSKNS